VDPGLFGVDADLLDVLTVGRTVRGADLDGAVDGKDLLATDRSETEHAEDRDNGQDPPNGTPSACTHDRHRGYLSCVPLA
jgi:hypothetical protein